VVIPEPHTTQFRAIQASVDALNETARQRYLGAGGLVGRHGGRTMVQQRVWGVDDSPRSRNCIMATAVRVLVMDPQ
jgi:hypothetical protein